TPPGSTPHPRRRGRPVPLPDPKEGPLVRIPLARASAAAAALLALPCLASVAPAQTVTRISATLTGIEENPSLPSPARGTADLAFDSVTGVLTCAVTSDLAAATVAHVHDGPVGVNGPIAVGLAPTGPGDFTGSGPLAAGLVTDLFREGLYVNVHSGAFPAGEIRGQIRVPTEFRSNLTAGKEVPPPPSLATAKARFTLNQPAGTLTYDVQATGLVATAAHIHRGAVGVNGPIVFPLTQTGPATFSGTTGPLTNADFVDLLTNRFYVNVHTAAFPGGEIRDQVHVGGLNVDAVRFGIPNGIETRFFVGALPELAGKLYWVLGSASGTAPGLVVDGLPLPLNIDSYLLFTISNPNSALLPGSLGFTNAVGEATGKWNVPPGAAAGLAGVVVNHAFVVFDPVLSKVVATSNAKPITIF
ncbi:MAG TPA: CHRD domain-containing protein, partial [Planctomycetota bacterium]|nr:CHRD domain-containing protein [Planctomycetota bacterium]